MPQLSAQSASFVGPLLPEVAQRPSFAGAELVSIAAALYDNRPRWQGDEGRTFRLVISPGTVGVRLSDSAVLERNSLNAYGHDTRGTREVYAPAPEAVGDPAYITDPGRWVRPPSAGSYLDFGRHLEAGEYPALQVGEVHGEPEWRDPIPARQVQGWSRRSRSGMVRRLAQLDWSPMYAAGRAAVMVTLTYPGEWEVVAPTGQAVKAHHHALLKRWARRWHVCGDACQVVPRKGRAVPAAMTRKNRGASTRVRWVTLHHWAEPAHVWKLEFQRRGAPHLHLMVVPPRDPEFRAWLSKAWADVVGHPDPEEYRKHLLAGTGVDHLRGGRAFDPKRAAVYFSKHGGAGGGKEYQHDVPELWQEPGAGPGRFWGYRGLVPATAEVTLTTEEYLQLRRAIRRWSRAQGMTRTRRIPRVDTRTGVVRTRKVTRPYVAVAHGGLQGGTVLLNDGPAFASALARLL